MKDTQIETGRIARFWRLVARNPNDGCWEWQGGRQPAGYGRIGTSGVNISGERLTHRIAWTLTNGPIPAGLCVLHRCDNPPCVNPAHLFLGTPKDNAQDRDQKGRNVVKRGTEHAQTALNDEQVAAVRADPRGCTTVARDYDVSEQTIWRIRNGKFGGLPMSRVPRFYPSRAGERNHAAKLTAEDVQAIRADPRPAKKVAPDYGVHFGHIHRIRQRNGWNHI